MEKKENEDNKENKSVPWEEFLLKKGLVDTKVKTGINNGNTHLTDTESDTELKEIIKEIEKSPEKKQEVLEAVNNIRDLFKENMGKDFTEKNMVEAKEFIKGLARILEDENKTKKLFNSISKVPTIKRLFLEMYILATANMKLKELKGSLSDKEIEELAKTTEAVDKEYIKIVGEKEFNKIKDKHYTDNNVYQIEILKHSLNKRRQKEAKKINGKILFDKLISRDEEQIMEALKIIKKEIIITCITSFLLGVVITSIFYFLFAIIIK